MVQWRPVSRVSESELELRKAPSLPNRGANGPVSAPRGLPSDLSRLQHGNRATGDASGEVMCDEDANGPSGPRGGATGVDGSERDRRVASTLHSHDWTMVMLFSMDCLTDKLKNIRPC